MSTRWIIRPFDRDQVEALSRASGMSPLVAHLLINRGITTSAAARAFLDAKLTGLHDPTLLPGVNEAAQRIVAAITSGRKIVVYGDYDVDGVCGTSLLWNCLKLAGAVNPSYYIPHRVEEGYGVNGDALRKLVTEERASLIITVDCGISAVEQAKLARELGVELIITDHHTIGGTLPDADVLVHPRLPGGSYPFGELCGCGVAFKLAWEICKSFGDGKKASPHLREFLMQSLGFVALATIADVVPIEDENRLLVRHGLEIMRKEASPGLRALMRVSGIDPSRGINPGQVGFKIGPRINAAGRLEHAMRAVELLTTSHADLADEIAEELNQYNLNRQETEKAMVGEAHAIIEEQGGLGERGAIVLMKDGWHAGVIGIVASRIAETYHRPTIILAINEDLAQGSARSVPTFNLYDAIAACSEKLLAFGGHAAAAGLKLHRSDFEEFADRFDHHCREALKPEQRQKTLIVDAEVPIAMITTKAVEDIERMQPFGIGNPQPLLVISKARVNDKPKFVGADGKTVQVKLGQDGQSVKCVAFGQADRWRKVSEGATCSVVAAPQINEYNGYRSVQLMIRDFKVEDEDGGNST